MVRLFLSEMQNSWCGHHSFCHDVKGHAPEGLAVSFVTQLEFGNGHEQLRVGMGGTLFVVKVIHGTERLYVMLDGNFVFNFTSKRRVIK